MPRSSLTSGNLIVEREAIIVSLSFKIGKLAMSNSSGKKEPPFFQKHCWELIFAILAGIITTLFAILPKIIEYHLGYSDNSPKNTESHPQNDISPKKIDPLAPDVVFPRTQHEKGSIQPGRGTNKTIEEKKASSSDAKKFLD